jgi:phosphate transport system substrate-binding protein
MKFKSLLNVALSAAVAASFMIVGSATAGTKITGAGASFPAPIYSEWFKDLAKKNKW